jgi:hypothetical protein
VVLRETSGCRDVGPGVRLTHAPLEHAAAHLWSAERCEALTQVGSQAGEDLLTCTLEQPPGGVVRTGRCAEAVVVG